MLVNKLKYIINCMGKKRLQGGQTVVYGIVIYQNK